MPRGRRANPNGEAAPKKSKDQIKLEIVNRVRKVVRKGVARLNAAEVKSSGDPFGNYDLLKAYKEFDTQLEQLVAPAETETEAA